MGYWVRMLVLLLWRVRRRLAPDGSPLERLLRLPRQAIRGALGDRKPQPTALRRQADAEAAPEPDGPIVSLLVPIGAASEPALAETLLTETIDAILAQTYPHWELWLCDIGVGPGPAWTVAQACAVTDQRVRVISTPDRLRPPLHPADILNQALKSAVGELVGVVNAGDTIAPNALEVMLAAREERAGADLLYSDENSIDTRGVTGAPLRKPNWSPELILAYPYTGRLCLLSRELALELGGWRAECLAAEEYDLVLRAARRGVRIEHVGQTLYHRRRRRDGEPDVFGSMEAVEARRAALAEHLAQRGIAAEIVDIDGPARLRVRPRIEGQPLVSIIIPTRDKLPLLQQCITSIEAKTHDLSYEIIIVDNNSAEPETLAYFASCGHRIVPYPGPFNFAGEINAGARAARGEYLLLLNNDTEVISPGWLTALLEWAQVPGIGCVGAKLLFDDHAFQHVGIALYQGSAHHPFYLKQPGDGNRWTDTELVRNCAGATAACLLVQRERFEELGGFDESFPINYNDIDFCIRLAEKGYRNLYTPYAVLYHHESSSRPPGVTEAEHTKLRERHGPLLWNDPYWGPSARPIDPVVVAARANGHAVPAPEPLLATATRALTSLVRTRVDRETRLVRQIVEAARTDGEGETFYGLPVSSDIPTEVGSSVAIRWTELVDVGGEPKLGLFMHPPYSRGFIVKLPPQAAVRVSSALAPEVWKLNRGGVQFTVTVGPLGGGPLVSRSWIVNPGENPDDRGWKTITLDLAAYAGQTVEVRLGTAVAPGAPSAYAWSLWGDPRLIALRPTREALRAELKSGLKEARSRGIGTTLKKYRALGERKNGASIRPFQGYEIWLERHLRDEAGLEWTRRESERFSYRPTISLITPVYNTDPKWLELLVASVKGQTYPNWELCLCDDGSSNPATIRYLDGLAGVDPRIKTARLPKNGGISAASNGALALATGEFVGLLDHDDELTRDALYEVVKVLNEHPDADLIYSDEDKLETDGRPCEPFFKPDWSPDYLNSTMYVGHLGVYRRTMVDTVGGFRSEFDGTQDYDLALRFSEHTNRVQHIPRILYRWRKIAGSTAAAVEAKPWGFDASFRALADHATRLSLPARAENRPGSGYARVRYQIVNDPLVSIIIPTDGRIVDTAYGPRDLLLTCVRSVVERTAYKRYELLIVDNGHLSAASEAYLATVPHRRITYSYTDPFNFANKVNFAVGRPGVEHARGEHLLLLNDDIEVIGEEWLSAMLEFSQQPDVGAVGAKLYFPDGRLQHVGVVIGIGGGACHIYSGQPKEHPGHFGAAKVIRDFSAVTGACMMTSRTAFDRVGGFDETFLTDFNDVDYCLRLRELGYRIVYTPFAELCHYEGATFGSRERIVNPSEVSAFGKRWGRVIENDPYYNPNLTRSSLTYDVRL